MLVVRNNQIERPNLAGGNMRKYVQLFIAVLLICYSGYAEGKKETRQFPDFITSNKDYYITRIGEIPDIDPDTYRLKIKGLVAEQKEFSLDELYAMEMKELPLTIECIGNSSNGTLISTAVWKGFYLYDFLESLGMNKTATGVRYVAADGYYASHTMDQVKNNHVMIALFMNGVKIPPVQGFPVRVLNPGYYGVKQPAWVTEIEVIDKPVKDYWEDKGWDCSPPMRVDSTIFFPGNNTVIKEKDKLAIGGAAYGGTRIVKISLTIDEGKHWIDADIIREMDADNVWVLWEKEVSFPGPGLYNVKVRATDTAGNQQPLHDSNRLDGTNTSPFVSVEVRK
jgi:hypothetical protein